MPLFELEEASGGEAKEFSIIPDGTVCDAVVTKIETKVMPYKDDDGKEISKVEFTFSLQGDYEGRRAWGNTSTSFVDHPGCRLRNWTQEIIGQELPVGFRLNTDSLIGSDCRVSIGVRKFVDKEGKNQERNYAADVLRTKESVSAGFDEPF